MLTFGENDSNYVPPILAKSFHSPIVANWISPAPKRSKQRTVEGSCAFSRPSRCSYGSSHTRPSSEHRSSECRGAGQLRGTVKQEPVPASDQILAASSPQNFWSGAMRTCDAARTICAVKMARASASGFREPKGRKEMRNPRHHKLIEMRGNTTDERRKRLCAGRSSALNCWIHSRISIMDSEQAKISEAPKEARKVLTKQFCLDVELD